MQKNYNFCTLFNTNYLSRGLALYYSLVKQIKHFTLYVVAFDDASFAILNNLNLKNLVVINLADFEDQKLLEVKPTRTPVEYCWTCTPSVILYILNKYKLANLVYLDADLYFFNSPKLMLDCFSNSDILLTTHNYTPKYDNTEKSGIFCVQFVGFNNNSNGRKALQYWREKCIQWCYNRVEKNKFGDQKYLDDWPERFNKVKVFEHPGVGVAPWNIQKFKITKNNLSLNNKIYPVIFYHFHGLKIIETSLLKDSYKIKADCGLYKLNYDGLEFIYKPYLATLAKIGGLLNKRYSSLNIHGIIPQPNRLASVKLSLSRQLKGINNIINQQGSMHATTNQFTELC